MNLNYLLTALLMTLAITPRICAGEPRIVDDAYLESLRAEVRTNHPTLAAARERVLAAEAGIRAVRRWEDPTAGFGVMAADREMRADDGDLIFSAEQMLPRRKLYEAEQLRASAERGILVAETRTAALNLETLVAQSVIELALTDEMLAIETNQLGWLESMTANAREKLRDPMATASEPLRLESELAQERQRIESTGSQRTRMGRQLNILLGRGTDNPWPKFRLPEARTLVSAPPLAAAEELARIHEVNPMLQAILGTAEAAKAEQEIARRERRPVFSVGVDSSVYSGGEFRQATVGAKMTLPWFNHSVYRANSERARHQQAAAEREGEAMARRLRGEAVAALTEVETSARQAKTFAEEILPRTQQAAESTRIAWISAKAGILEVLEAQRSLLNARLEERRAVAAHRSALEMLRSIIPPGPSSGTQP